MPLLDAPSVGKFSSLLMKCDVAPESIARCTRLVCLFGAMYHFGNTVLSFKSVPDMGKDK